MKNSIFYLIFFIISGQLMGQENLLSEANQLLQNKDYKLANVAYLKAEKQGYESTALYYNLGISYFELNEFPASILYFEKALKLDPHDENIQHNLHLARQKTENDFIEVEDFFLKRWWSLFVSFLSASSWTLLIFLMTLLTILSFYFYLFSNKEALKKWGMRSFYPLLVILLVFVLAGVNRVHILKSSSTAILLEKNEMYQGPDERSEKDYDLLPGSKVRILNAIDGWLKVELINKESGWIKDQGVGRI